MGFWGVVRRMGLAARTNIELCLHCVLLIVHQWVKVCGDLYWGPGFWDWHWGLAFGNCIGGCHFGLALAIGILVRTKYEGLRTQILQSMVWVAQHRIQDLSFGWGLSLKKAPCPKFSGFLI